MRQPVPGSDPRVRPHRRSARDRGKSDAGQLVASLHDEGGEAVRELSLDLFELEVRRQRSQPGAITFQISRLALRYSSGCIDRES
jgi:hypothetical protein